jgi:hypothetical protein
MRHSDRHLHRRPCHHVSSDEIRSVPTKGIPAYWRNVIQDSKLWEFEDGTLRLSDTEWAIIQLLLPNKPRSVPARTTSGC